MLAPPFKHLHFNPGFGPPASGSVRGTATEKPCRNGCATDQRFL